MKNLLHVHSLRLRFIAGTSIGLVLISLLYALLAVTGQDIMQDRYANQWMTRELNILSSLAYDRQGHLQVQTPINPLRQRLYIMLLFDEQNRLLWQSRDEPSFRQLLQPAWLQRADLYEIQSPQLLPGSHDQQGEPILATPEEDSLFTPSRQFNYYVRVQHYPASTTHPALRAVLIDTMPEEREDNRFLWRVFQAAMLLNLLVLLPLVWFVAKWSFRPIARLTRAVHELEMGKQQQLVFEPPEELSGLVHHLNRLLQQQRQQLERYRHSLDDLAHSIKTPLAVLQSTFHSLRENPSLMSEQEPLIQTQISRIAQQIGYYLRRAVLGSELGLLRQQQAVEPLVSSLCKALRKVYDRKGVVLTLQCEPGLLYYGDRNDFLEIAGNIVENGCKYCLEYVDVRLYNERQQLVLEVNDDGPGVPEHRREQILQRGVRIDTLKPGQGIGLAVAAEILQANGGSMSIEQSELGGARFILRFEQPNE